MVLAVVLPNLLLCEEGKPVEVPPEPAQPGLQGLTPEQATAATLQWQEDEKKWRSSLTPEQKAELGRQRAQKRERFGRMPNEADGYDWKSEARSRGLTPAEIEQLGRRDLLIGRRSFRQCFESYVSPRGPTFITSDSVLNTFSDLFETTFRELELRRAPQLRRNLEAAVRNVRKMLDAPPFARSELQPGWLQAQRAAGPAMVLLGSSLDRFDPEVRNDIMLQVGKIRAAKAVELPDWLAPATESFLGIDYRRCRPVGFYEANRGLADYFRAVRWLQMVPFRIDRERELAAIVILGHGAEASKEFLEAYESFLGPAEGLSLKDAGQACGAVWRPRPGGTFASKLQDQRRFLPMGNKASPVNDDLRLGNREPGAFHILAAYQLPDAAVFQFLINNHEPVSGLDLAALAGSSWARSQIKPQQPEILAKALEQGRKLTRVSGWDEDSAPVYHDYLLTLSALFEPPDPDAPGFMKSEAWSAKSCQTALAGWTQIRHTFVLQAKVAVSTLGVEEMPPGFIEPNPAFFRRFTELVQHTEEKLRTADVFSESGVSAGARLVDAADLIDVLRAKVLASQPGDRLAGSFEMEQFRNLVDTPNSAGDLIRDEAGEKVREAFSLMEGDPAKFAAALGELGAVFRKEAARYEVGELAGVPEPKWRSLAQRWTVLDHTVSRLETLLQKQLRHQPWTGGEGRIIKDYGGTIAYVMGYFGNEYIPRDDTPRWVEVVRSPSSNDSFAAAIGRPRAFYVLYPWNGVEVLCEGAVIPYYDDHSPSILTDSEWREKLDSSRAPKSPDWLAPLVGAD
jgi:hypothetical protein